MRNSKLFNTAAYLTLTAIVTMLLIQVALLFIIAGKTQSQMGAQPMLPTFPYHFENYERAWKLGIDDYMLNSIIYAVTIVSGSTFLSCITAYVFARYEFPLKNLIFTAILALMMIPGILTLVPRFVLVRDLGLLNKMGGVIIPGILGVNAFQIVVFRTFFTSLPEELFEAARVDGAGHFTLFARITVPLSWPIITSMSILSFHSVWNDWLWPLLVLNNDKLRPVSIGLLLLATRQNPQIGVQMAGSIIASIPMIIIFIFAMRSFVEGLSAGAIKI